MLTDPLTHSSHTATSTFTCCPASWPAGMLASACKTLQCMASASRLTYQAWIIDLCRLDHEPHVCVSKGRLKPKRGQVSNALLMFANYLNVMSRSLLQAAGRTVHEALQQETSAGLLTTALCQELLDLLSCDGCMHLPHACHHQLQW